MSPALWPSLSPPTLGYRGKPPPTFLVMLGPCHQCIPDGLGEPQSPPWNIFSGASSGLTQDGRWEFSSMTTPLCLFLPSFTIWGNSGIFPSLCVGHHTSRLLTATQQDFAPSSGGLARVLNPVSSKAPQSINSAGPILNSCSLHQTLQNPMPGSLPIS